MAPRTTFFISQYEEGYKRYCQGVRSKVARDLFKVGTSHGYQPKGICSGLTCNYLNAVEELPACKSNLIIIPWMTDDKFDFETTNYDKNSFDADVVDYKISQEEFAAVLNDLKKSEFWIPQYTFSWSIWIGMMIVPLILLTLAGVVVAHGYDKAHPILYFTVVGSCPLMSILTFLSPFFVYKANQSRLTSRETEFEKILTTWNHRVFSDRKVKWKIGKYGAWLEIHFDKDLKNLASFNQEVIEKAKEEIYEDYKTEAEKLKIDISGQKPRIGSVGCEKRIQGSVDNLSSGKRRGDERMVGDAIPTEDNSLNDDLEIKNVHMGMPLLKN